MASKAITSVASKGAVSSETALSFALDIFETQDLKAYVTVVHHSVKKVIELLMQELGQDSSKIDWKSKGFLEVW